MNDNRTKIIELLRSTSRGGIENVITWLDTEPSFFTASAARIHHDNVEGGLANHSLNVFRHAKEDWDTRDDAFKKKYPFESVIISALLHDVCKKDVYYIDADGIPQWNEENHRKGHGLRSVHLLEDLGLSLTPDERMAIWWHMGVRNEASKDDYPEENAIAMKDPFCQLIQSADHMAAKSSDKAEEKRRIASLSWDAKRTLFRLENSGAFGCGVFQLKPELVAKYFKQVLDEEEFRGKFHTIVFAMLEGKATPRKKVEEEGDFAPFYQIFGRFE